MRTAFVSVLFAIVLAFSALSGDNISLGLNGGYLVPSGGLSSELDPAFGWSLSASYNDLFYEGLSVEILGQFVSFASKSGGTLNEDNLKFLLKYGIDITSGTDRAYIFGGSGSNLNNSGKSVDFGLEYTRKLGNNINLNIDLGAALATGRVINGVSTDGAYLNISAGLSYGFTLTGPTVTTNDAVFLNADQRIKDIAAAFIKDDFDVDLTPGKGIFDANHKRGVLAVHKYATIGGTSDRKKAYYVEGKPYEMGYLMGMMAEPDVEKMCVKFNNQVVLDFVSIDIKDEKTKKLIGGIISDIAAFDIALTGMPLDVPEEYREEITGIYDGCVKVNPNTKVTRKALWVLNTGIDSLLSFLYSGHLPDRFPLTDEYKKYITDPSNFRVPLYCNALTMGGSKLSNNGFLFGRDFMFPTGDTYQDTACYEIRKPENGALPTISLCAPGMIGTPAGLNSKQVGVGIDMSPSGNSNPNRPGLNSLLMNRYAIEYGETIDTAINKIANTTRGVTWMYVLADGKTSRSCCLEAGMSADSLDYLSFVPKDIRDSGILPSADWIKAHPSAEYRNGVMLRWNNWHYPAGWLDLNKHLMDFDKLYKTKLVPLALLLKDYNYTYDALDFNPSGYLNKTRQGTNCPCGFYFAPQREDMDDVLMVTNHCLIPEMRLCAMNEWTQFLASGNIQDIQWRYDELNNQVNSAIAAGPIDNDKFKRLIDYLDPKYNPDYYNPDRKPLTQVFVHGSVSVMDLKENVIDSLYGYYSDKWVKVHFNEYLK